MPSSLQPLLKEMAVNTWFAALPAPVRECMVGRSGLLHLGPGEMLYCQGEAPRALYGVLRGTIRLSTLQDNGREHVMGHMEAGVWLGESALVVRQPYLNNAVAQGEARILALPAEAFDELMREAAFARAMAELVTERFRVLYAALTDTALRSTRSRIAQRLLLLAHGDAAGVPQARLRLRVSQEALATMLGITRQTLNLELQDFARLGLVGLGYRCIDILSEDGLRGIGDAEQT